jgi:hypothetical protein
MYNNVPNNVPNNQNPVASEVQENAPAMSEGMKNAVKVVVALGVVVATSALTFGICVGATKGDTSQCVAPPIISAMVATPVIIGYNYLNDYLRSFQSEMNPVSSASLAASVNPTLVASANPTLVGIPVLSGFPTAPELNSASGAPSPRASLDLERGPQNITNPINQIVNGDLVFQQINH